MYRNRLAFLGSLIALSAATVIWGDLFRWSKVVYIPKWAEILPAPIYLPAYLAFVCLLPAAFATDSSEIARASVLKCVLLAPVASIAAFALSALHPPPFISVSHLIINTLFHYIWIVLFFCALPAFFVVLIRTLSSMLAKQYMANKPVNRK